MSKKYLPITESYSSKSSVCDLFYFLCTYNFGAKLTVNRYLGAKKSLFC
jgi:hypothetical protein